MSRKIICGSDDKPLYEVVYTKNATAKGQVFCTRVILSPRVVYTLVDFFLYTHIFSCHFHLVKLSSTNLQISAFGGI